MPLTVEVRNDMLDELNLLATHASLHTADPAGTGANEVVGGSYIRQPITWADAAAGVKTMVGTATFQVPAGTTVTHAGLWTAATAGTFRGGGALAAPLAFPVAGPYVLSLVSSAVATAAVPLDGGTMTGLLVLSGPPTVALGAATKDYVDDRVSVIDARAYGAVHDGTTSDSAAIAAACAAALAGDVVQLQANHAVTVPVVVPPGVTLRGLHGENLDQQLRPTLIPKSTFTGSAVIRMVDQATGSYAVTSNDQNLQHLTVDGRNLPAGTVHGIETVGYVHGLRLMDVTCRNLTGQGFKVTTNGSGWAYTVHAIRFNVNNVDGNGIDAWISDCTFVDCEVIGVDGHGWVLDGPANSAFIGCRAEWCGLNGFEVTGSYSGTGSGGPQLIGCSTDRNTHHGVHVSATSNAPINIIGGVFRRDGRGGAASGYAGIFVDATTSPVVISGAVTYTGVDDDGGGVNGPQYGLHIAGSALVSYSGSFHGADEGVHDGSGNTSLLRGLGVVERTGTTASPTTVIRRGWLSEAGVLTIDTATVSPIVRGSVSSAGNLTLSSTSHATKGKVLFGTSAYDEANNRLGIGTASPGVALEVVGQITASTIGQAPVVQGGTGSGGTLTLKSTTNATKGKILVGTSAYDEVNDRLGIGTATPTVPLDVVGDAAVAGVFTAGVTGGDTVPRFGVSATGIISLGSGSGARDVTLGRNGGNAIQTNSYFEVVRSSQFDPGFGVVVAGDSNPRFAMNAGGGMGFGSGAAGTDTALYRDGVGSLRTDTKLTVGTDLTVSAVLQHNGASAGFFNTAAIAKPTVTGSRGGNAALASALTALANLGLLTNSSSA